MLGLGLALALAVYQDRDYFEASVHRNRFLADTMCNVACHTHLQRIYLVVAIICLHCLLYVLLYEINIFYYRHRP